MSLLRKVPLPELGPNRHLTEASAAVSFRMRELRKRAEAGEDVYFDQIVETLKSCVVDDAGQPVFPHQDAAIAALESIPARALGALSTKFAELAKDLRAEGDSGNSEPSPSAS